MSIDLNGQVVAFDTPNVAVLQTILEGMAADALGVIFRSTVPTANQVPVGKLVIVDDGASTKRIYVRTGRGNLGYINLT